MNRIIETYAMNTEEIVNLAKKILGLLEANADSIYSLHPFELKTITTTAVSDGREAPVKITVGCTGRNDRRFQLYYDF